MFLSIYVIMFGLLEWKPICACFLMFVDICIIAGESINR